MRLPLCTLVILLCGCSRQTSVDIPVVDEPAKNVYAPIANPDDLSDGATKEPHSEEPYSEEPQVEEQPEAGQPVKDTLPTAEEEYPRVDYTVTAAELIAEYKEDKSAWRKKYNYKPCELTGTVVGYKSRFIQGHSGFSILLEDSGDGIAVTLNEETPWTRYLPGATITVRGKVKSSGGLEVNNGIVVQATAGADVPAFTAEELLKATEADRFPDNPGLKRGDWMLFNATVLKRDTDYEETGVLHVGTEAQSVEVWTAGGSSGNYDHRQCRELAPGDEVTFLARYRTRSDEACVVSPAFLMAPLPQLPRLPSLESRKNADGLPFDHLIFTADLLGEWQAADPRALERVIDRNSRYAQTELSGEVAEIVPSEEDEDIMKVHVRNAAGADLQCWVQKRELPADFKPGSKFTARGALNIELEYAYLNEPEIYPR